MFVHKVSLVIPRASKDTFILSRRSKDKFPWPDKWVCAIGGKVAANESYEDAALRETKEEAGMNLKLVYVTEFKHDSEEYKGIFRIFTTKEPININSMVPHPGEIQYFKAFTLNQIEKMVKDKPEDFAPTFIAAIKAFIRDIKY
jgi:16S rRNA (adenine1518-N6/adenine1519-N6)-dimethyltransferase